MPTLKETLKSKIINDMLRAVNPPKRWKLLIVDPAALRILNAVCKRSDILSQNVTVIEGLYNKRQPQQDTEAIYFIAPIQESVRALINDYDHTRPPYAAVHLFSTAALPDLLFDRIKNSPVSKHLQTCRELNMDFYAPDPESFHFDYPDCWFSLFNPQAPSLQKYEIDNIAKRLASVLASLGDFPYIRYHTRPTPFSTTPQKSLSQELAFLLQSELETLSNQDRSFPKPLPANTKRSILIIADRSIDPIAPLVHEFSYQAMIADLIGLDANSNYKDPRDGPDAKPHTLDETDSVWSQCRTWHIAEVLEHLPTLLSQFTSQNKAAKWEIDSKSSNSGGGNDNRIQGLKDAMGSLNEYQELKTRYALHTNICEHVMHIYNSRQLELISNMEQNLVTVLPTNTAAVASILQELMNMVGNPNIHPLDKTRLIMIALAALGGVSETDRESLIEKSLMTKDDKQALSNLSILNVRLSASLVSSSSSRRNNASQEYKNPYAHAALIPRTTAITPKFDNSRYVPVVQYIMDDLVRLNGGIDVHVFPWVRDPPEGEYNTGTNNDGRRGSWGDTSSSSMVPTRKKPSWASRKPITPSTTTASASSTTSLSTDTDYLNNGPRIILFILGGVTYSEIRATHAIKKQYQRDVLIGSTHVWCPDAFVMAMRQLHRGNGDMLDIMAYRRPVTMPPSPSSQQDPNDGYDRSDRRSRGSDRDYQRSQSRSRGNRESAGRSGRIRSKSRSRGEYDGASSPAPPMPPVPRRNPNNIPPQPDMPPMQQQAPPPRREGPSWSKSRRQQPQQAPPPNTSPTRLNEPMSRMGFRSQQDRYQQQQPPPPRGYVGMDPRDRGMDPRDRGMDPRDRGMDPRDRGMGSQSSLSSMSPPSTRSNSAYDMSRGMPPPNASRSPPSSSRYRQPPPQSSRSSASQPPTRDWLRSQRDDGGGASSSGSYRGSSKNGYEDDGYEAPTYDAKPKKPNPGSNSGGWFGFGF